MASVKCNSVLAKNVRSSISSVSTPIRAPRSVSVRAVHKLDASEVSKKVAVGVAAATTLLCSGNAIAAQEMVSVAGGDNRIATIGLLFVPALGWVGFNMLQPLLNQLEQMNEKRSRSVAATVGLGAAASLLLAQNAEAATQVAELAGGDNRIATIGLLFVPALGWVGFNMLQPLLNQLEQMNEKRSRSVAATVGLGAAASLLLAQNAEAATQVAELAGGDNRIATIGLLFVPALGWVGFNMLQPLLNQLEQMNEKRK